MPWSCGPPSGDVGAKIYYLVDQLPSISLHDLRGMGFTWYGGLLGGIAAALVVIRRHRLPGAVVAGAVAVPLSLAYAIGRLGCPSFGGRDLRPSHGPTLGHGLPRGRCAHRRPGAPDPPV